MTKIGYDNIHVDKLQIVQDTRCCLKVNAVITKEGVYQYPDGRAFKSKMELLKATHTARNAKITILNHPDSLVVMSQKHIHGTVEKPFFDRDRIRAVLNFDKSTCDPTFLDGVRAGTLKDVSIGFYYQPDATPGTWNGNDYDYVMRDIVIDHVAAGVLRGRCSFPDCGIGVDAMMKRIALDPFGEYASFEDCVAKNQGKDDPEAYCAALKRQIEGSQQTGGQNNTSAQPKSAEYDQFIADYMTQGHTREQAEQHWKAITGAQDPADEKNPLQQCVAEQVAAGKTEAEAEAFCNAKLAAPAEDQVPEEPPPPTTPLEQCIAEQMAQGKTAEEAGEWCRSELAGEHEAADALIARSKTLIALREHAAIEQRRRERRHPL